MEHPGYEFEFSFDRAFLHRAHWRDYYWQPLLAVVLTATRLAYRRFAGALTGGAVLGAVLLLSAALFLFGLGYRWMIAQRLKEWGAFAPGGVLVYSVDEAAITCHAGEVEARASGVPLGHQGIQRVDLVFP